MFGLILLGIVLLTIIVLIMLYNRLVALRQNCRQGMADIDAQLQQRNDLIPNLVSTVKGYATHEKETLDQVISARNAAMANPGPTAEAALGGALGKLIALGEAYPDLKANANFQQLQGELADTEDKLAAARRAMNSASADYNTARESFPAVLIANMFGFQPFDFIEIAADRRASVSAVPKVEF